MKAKELIKYLEKNPEATVEFLSFIDEIPQYVRNEVNYVFVSEKTPTIVLSRYEHIESDESLAWYDSYPDFDYSNY